MVLSIIMTSAMCLQSNTKEEGILVHTNAKCSVVYTSNQLVDHCVT